MSSAGSSVGGRGIAERAVGGHVLGPPHDYIHLHNKCNLQGGGPTSCTCASCGQKKPFIEFAPNPLNRSGMQHCQVCVHAMQSAAAHGAGFRTVAAPTRIAPAAGEGFVRCVACCQLKPTSSFGVNQLRRRAGIERCAACVESDKGSMVLCTSCHKQRPFTDFSKKQLACKPGSERCRQCIEESTTS